MLRLVSRLLSLALSLLLALPLLTVLVLAPLARAQDAEPAAQDSDMALLGCRMMGIRFSFVQQDLYELYINGDDETIKRSLAGILGAEAFNHQLCTCLLEDERAGRYATGVEQAPQGAEALYAYVGEGLESYLAPLMAPMAAMRDTGERYSQVRDRDAQLAQVAAASFKGDPIPDAPALSPAVKQAAITFGNQDVLGVAYDVLEDQSVIGIARVSEAVKIDWQNWAKDADPARHAACTAPQ